LIDARRFVAVHTGGQTIIERGNGVGIVFAPIVVEMR